jgi:hypothetical protein
VEAIAEVLKIGGPPAVVTAVWLWYLNKKDCRDADTLRGIGSDYHESQEADREISEKLLIKVGELEGVILRQEALIVRLEQRITELGGRGR